ncbi:MAG: YaiI/YqxD family protein [Cetobacterium sp.]|uniref:YaiI/YqxD family protein n=1 Tax=unclassified Cetobacterium TaxID=2630983 RepID=UPI00163C5EDC|nr:YaiI/YqxD family protein [Cetobacterium sp. 2A]MBC2856721.1 YaiI/YqxD family protein [Cetobacterium sp. 2A]
MKVLIDADACPVTDIAIRIAKEFNLETIIVCDTAHKIERAGVETVVISQGADAVDFAIISRVSNSDIVITQDYGLASIVLSKNAHAINQDGLVYNKYNIESLLFSRHMSQKLRNSGKRTKGPKKRLKDDDIRFEESFRRIVLNNIGKKITKES